MINGEWLHVNNYRILPKIVQSNHFSSSPPFRTLLLTCWKTSVYFSHFPFQNPSILSHSKIVTRDVQWLLSVATYLLRRPSPNLCSSMKGYQSLSTNGPFYGPSTFGLFFLHNFLFLRIYTLHLHFVHLSSPPLAYMCLLPSSLCLNSLDSIFSSLNLILTSIAFHLPPPNKMWKSYED